MSLRWEEFSVWAGPCPPGPQPTSGRVTARSFASCGPLPPSEGPTVSIRLAGCRNRVAAHGFPRRPGPVFTPSYRAERRNSKDSEASNSLAMAVRSVYASVVGVPGRPKLRHATRGPEAPVCWKTVDDDNTQASLQSQRALQIARSVRASAF